VQRNFKPLPLVGTPLGLEPEKRGGGRVVEGKSLGGTG